MGAALRTGLALVFVLGVAACGGGSGGTSSTAASTTTATTSPAAEKAQIEQVYRRFFSSKTPASQKAQLLQNGSQFTSVIQQMSKSPLAAHTSATVSKVALQGPSKAKVVYTIDVAGTPALKRQSGAAVRVHGVWKVGDGSFCSLIALQGSTPKACRSG